MKHLQAYLSEVNLVKDNLVRMSDSIEAREKGKKGDDGQRKLVVPIMGDCFLGLLLNCG